MTNTYLKLNKNTTLLGINLQKYFLKITMDGNKEFRN